MAKNREEKGYESGGIAFIGCIILGVGFGVLYNSLVVGTLFGVGGGFIVMALLRAILGRK